MSWTADGMRAGNCAPARRLAPYVSASLVFVVATMTGGCSGYMDEPRQSQQAPPALTVLASPQSHETRPADRKVVPESGLLGADTTIVGLNIQGNYNTASSARFAADRWISDSLSELGLKVIAVTDGAAMPTIVLSQNESPVKGYSSGAAGTDITVSIGLRVGNSAIQPVALLRWQSDKSVSIRTSGDEPSRSEVTRILYETAVDNLSATVEYHVVPYVLCLKLKGEQWLHDLVFRSGGFILDNSLVTYRSVQDREIVRSAMQLIYGAILLARLGDPQAAELLLQKVEHGFPIELIDGDSSMEALCVTSTVDCGTPDFAMHLNRLSKTHETMLRVLIFADAMGFLSQTEHERFVAVMGNQAIKPPM
jgi:hypothetical protein